MILTIVSINFNEALAKQSQLSALCEQLFRTDSTNQSIGFFFIYTFVNCLHFILEYIAQYSNKNITKCFRGAYNDKLYSVTGK